MCRVISDVFLSTLSQIIHGSMLFYIMLSSFKIKKSYIESQDWYCQTYEIDTGYETTNFGFGTGVGLELLSMEVARNSNLDAASVYASGLQSGVINNIVISFPLDLAPTWTANTISSACPRHFAEGKPCEWVCPCDITPACTPLSLMAYLIKVYLCFLARYMILEAGMSCMRCHLNFTRLILQFCLNSI